MPDHGHELRFGAFCTPTAADPQGVVALAQAAERAGLDLVTFQDHPYQPRFLDTCTLLSYVAARTETMLDASGTSGPSGADLTGSPPAWAERLTGLALDPGFSTFVLFSDDPGLLARFGAEVAPAVRDAVAAQRGAAARVLPS